MIIGFLVIIYICLLLIFWLIFCNKSKLKNLEIKIELLEKQIMRRGTVIINEYVEEKNK